MSLVLILIADSKNLRDIISQYFFKESNMEKNSEIEYTEYSVPQYAKTKNITIRAVYYQIEKGYLQVKKQGGRWKVMVKENTITQDLKILVLSLKDEIVSLRAQVNELEKRVLTLEKDRIHERKKSNGKRT